MGVGLNNFNEDERSMKLGNRNTFDCNGSCLPISITTDDLAGLAVKYAHQHPETTANEAYEFMEQQRGASLLALHQSGGFESSARKIR